jgi:polysaccharide export outer membrane protein
MSGFYSLLKNLISGRSIIRVPGAPSAFAVSVTPAGEPARARIRSADRSKAAGRNTADGPFKASRSAAFVPSSGRGELTTKSQGRTFFNGLLRREMMTSVLVARTRLVASLLGLILAAGCSTMPENRMAGTDLPDQPNGNSAGSTVAADINRNIAAMAMGFRSGDYQIGPEDQLQITLFNIPQGDDGTITPRTVTVRVSQQGNITLPLLGEIAVKGLTVTGLEQKLRDHYDRYMHDPQVGVLVKEFRQRVSVIGAVNKPGVYQLRGPQTIIDILAMAGGVTPKAGSQVHVYRQGPGGRESHVIDLSVLVGSTGLINADNAAKINLPVQAGDMINVPPAGMYFVDGAVRRPGSYPLGRQYYLTQALATAGGVDFELNSNDISIFRRRGPGKVDTIAINLNDVMDGTVPDPQIQPDDVIVVPRSTGKYLVKRFVGSLVGGMSIRGFFP